MERHGETTTKLTKSTIGSESSTNESSTNNKTSQIQEVYNAFNGMLSELKKEIAKEPKTTTSDEVTRLTMLKALTMDTSERAKQIVSNFNMIVKQASQLDDAVANKLDTLNGTVETDKGLEK